MREKRTCFGENPFEQNRESLLGAANDRKVNAHEAEQ